MKQLHIVMGFLTVLLLSLAVEAAEWSYQWKPAPDAAVPTAQIAPFRYGKTFAYSIEIDDGNVGAGKVAQPLLARYHFTDAPPGVSGGKPKPFVAGAAVIVAAIGTANNTMMNWEQLRELQAQGWGIINHSYFHEGHSYGKTPRILTPEEFRRDLFWSQTLLGLELGDGRAPTHFVYPNGYTDYRGYLAAVGLRSASRVSAPSQNWQVYDPKSDFTDLNRSYLDEGYWSNWGKANPAMGIPENGPAPQTIFMDFTHGISAEPDSPNQQRWAQRLTLIESRWGAKGADSLWCAPTGEVLEYVAARKAAKLSVEAGRLSVDIPDDAPGTRLTIHLVGIDPATDLPVPDGGTLYRQGDSAWITTPMVGRPGAPLPAPAVERIYAGEVKNLSWDRPIQLAAVRLLQGSPAGDGFELTIDLKTPEGTTVALVPEAQRKLEKRWGSWLLFPTVPNQSALSVTGLTVSRERCLHKMEVWALKP